MKCLIVASLLLAAPAHTALASARYVGAAKIPMGTITDLEHLEIFGEITKDDVVTVTKLVRRYSVEWRSEIDTVNVFLNSPGGDVVAAMEIGKGLRKAHAWTLVLPGAKCSSACVFLLASGVERTVFQGAVLGLHRPRFDEKLFAALDADHATARYEALIEGCRRYFKEMGIQDRLLDDMLRIESRTISYKSREYARSVSLDGKDAGWGEWERAKAIQMFGEDYVRTQDSRFDCYNSGTPMVECDLRHESRSDRRKAPKTPPAPKKRGRGRPGESEGNS